MLLFWQVLFLLHSILFILEPLNQLIHVSLQPNGVVIVMNGNQQGLAGDSASGGSSKANYPNFFAEMYDPYKPVGQRWTTLERSLIPRQYHSVAALTSNGTILVSGCDRCGIVSHLTITPAFNHAVNSDIVLWGGSFSSNLSAAHEIPR